MKMSAPLKKISCPISSTPFLTRINSRKHDLGDLYDDIALSPIIPSSNVRKSNIPRPPKKHNLDDLHDDFSLSPITQSTNVGKSKVPPPAQPTRPIPASKKLAQTARPHTRKKTPELPKETASGAVLKELGIKPKILRANLSHSRNLYTTQAELVVLDSDEEGCMNSVTEIKSTATRNVREESKDVNIIGKKVKNDKELTTNQIEADVENLVKVPERRKAEEHSQPPITRNLRGIKRKQPLSNLANLPEHSKALKSEHTTVKRVTKKNQDNPSVIVLNNSDSIFKSCTNSGKKQKKKFMSTPLFDDIMNDNTIKWTPRAKSNIQTEQDVGKQEPSSIETDSLEEKNDRSPIKVGTLKRRTHKQLVQTGKTDAVSNGEVGCSQVINLTSGKNIKDCKLPDTVPKSHVSNRIVNSPCKRMQSKNRTGLQREKVEKTDDANYSEVRNDVNLILDKHIKECKLPDSKPKSRESDRIKNLTRNRIQVTKKTSLRKEAVESGSGSSQNEEANDSNPDAVLVSRFDDLLFKPSRMSGGIVAKALETTAQRMGYVEIEKNKVFSGTIRHVTFVVIEGKMKAFSQGTTHSLNPGDMIHFKTDAAYTLQNSGCDFTRLLFIKDTTA